MGKEYNELREKICIEITEILNEYQDKIGTIGEKDYNKDLDDICCRIGLIKETI